MLRLIIYHGGRMSTPAPDPNEPSKMKKILNASVDESIKARLPRGNGVKSSAPTPAPEATTAVPVVQTVETNAPPRRRKLLEAFWTVASIMSVTVNIVLVAILLILLNMLAGIQFTANDQISGLLGGLYTNFVKMDQATISTNILVQDNIPLNFTVPVDRSEATLLETEIKLSRAAVINGVRVVINQPGTEFRLDSLATITLPKDTILNVYIQRFDIPVQNSVPINLNVPVNIPLNQTQLHEAFFGLQQVVEPYYCLVEPNAVLNNQMVCGPNP